MCGGTSRRKRLPSVGGGLSPRVRGNRKVCPTRRRVQRSIPACAGEPSLRSIALITGAVYPRVCGGTAATNSSAADTPGLSPRVRGNRAASAWGPVAAGSIPACAGEPKSKGTSPSGTRVYPRVCGGTALAFLRAAFLAGLSPRVRGNQRLQAQPQMVFRSIPACAGEPSKAGAPAAAWRVYPRVCGGTWAAGHDPATLAGLSPRVRGNPPYAAPGQARRGSIPACAGEPGAPNSPSWGSRVYPRVCGGTTPSCRRVSCIRGLSPRVRGNRGALTVSHSCRRSIPACAGEPSMATWPCPFLTVYPRVCGGTVQRG